jgi:hypothetical protein
MESIGALYGHLVHLAYFVAFMVIKCTSPFLVCCIKKNLATLLRTLQCLSKERVTFKNGGLIRLFPEIGKKSHLASPFGFSHRNLDIEHTC